MILPTKHISQSEALIGVGATLLLYLDQPRTVSGLWECVRDEPNVGTFERFVLAVSLLHLLGALTMAHGQLVRASQ
jgi:hypothetical protein